MTSITVDRLSGIETASIDNESRQRKSLSSSKRARLNERTSFADTGERLLGHKIGTRPASETSPGEVQILELLERAGGLWSSMPRTT